MSLQAGGHCGPLLGAAVGHEGNFVLRSGDDRQCTPSFHCEIQFHSPDEKYVGTSLISAQL